MYCTANAKIAAQRQFGRKFIYFILVGFLGYVAGYF